MGRTELLNKLQLIDVSRGRLKAGLNDHLSEGAVLAQGFDVLLKSVPQRFVLKTHDETNLSRFNTDRYALVRLDDRYFPLAAVLLIGVCR